MKKYKIVTLGCKVNQYESDGIAQSLDQCGWKKAKNTKESDVVIVNTCAVTSKAGMQSRQAIRKLIRENPDARVIVTGCHVQTEPDQIKKIDHIHTLVSHRDKTRIASILDKDSPVTFKTVDHKATNTFSGFNNAVSGSMTRAYLKIQDGCNSFCTYCIVPYARGGSVSMAPNDVHQNLEQLQKKGFKEVILTGIHTGLYGLDFENKTSLETLLKKINQEKKIHRIRLSSIEPGEITDAIIDMALPGNIMCNHFHIPLQSGDDAVLKRMKRPYNVKKFSRIIDKIHCRIPDVSIGLDILIGFPGETEQQFENTYQLIKNLPVAYLHIFPFSRRKGTPAYHFKDQVRSDVIKERCRIMKTLDQEKRAEFIKQNIGKPLEGLIQHKNDRATNLLKAVTSNYLSVLVEGDPSSRGKIVDLIPKQCDSNLNVFGALIDS